MHSCMSRRGGRARARGTARATTTSIYCSGHAQGPDQGAASSSVRTYRSTYPRKRTSRPTLSSARNDQRRRQSLQQTPWSGMFKSSSPTSAHVQESPNPESGATRDVRKRSGRRPLTVSTPDQAQRGICTASSPIIRSPVRRLASASHCGPSGMSPTRKSALFSGLPLTELLEGCARRENGSLSTPDLRRLHEMIQSRHGGAYPTSAASRGNRTDHYSR